MDNDERTIRKAFDQRVSLVLKKCAESLDGTKTSQERPTHRPLQELLQMKQKEETTSGVYERLQPSDDISIGQEMRERLDSHGDESFSGGHKNRGGGRWDYTTDHAGREPFEPVKSGQTPKKKELADFSASRNGNYRKSPERTDFFVSDLSPNPQNRLKKINIHSSNLCKWSNAVKTIKTLQRHIKNDAMETDELLISHMLRIEFRLLQTMYTFIRITLPGFSEISELDVLTKVKILIAMDAIELWDKKQKELSIADFLNDLLMQFNSIEDFIKKLLAQTTDDNSIIEPVVLELMAHAFGLKIEYEWKME